MWALDQQNFPRNRAALSLLSFCYYQMQDYKAATTMYEQLVKVCPTVEEYKVSVVVNCKKIHKVFAGTGVLL